MASAMAAPGSIDEFFDFAKLDADMGNEAHTANHQHVPYAQDCIDPSLDAAMEWEPSIDEHGVLASLPSQLLPQDLSEPNIYQQSWVVPSGLSAPEEFGHEDFQQIDQSSAAANSTQLWPHHSEGVYPSVLQTPDISIVAAPNVAVAEPQPVPRREQVKRPARPARSSSISYKPASATHKGRSNRIPLEARQTLEDEFSTNPYPCTWEIDIMAHQLKLDTKQVRNWFNNTRARKKPSADTETKNAEPNECNRSLTSKLSVDSLEALAKEMDEGVPAPQPPLAVYLASSYLEEAAEMSDIQAAIHITPSSDEDDFFMDASSGSHMGRTGSIATSLASSEGSAPTSYTMSSSGSNISSFGRERRRGRRRMTWKTSPYQRAKIDGLDSSGQPARNLPFFCTFCPRAFRTKYEWIRHEDSVHALRTTWICCSGRNEPFEVCPFCGAAHPDEVHLAGHKYQQCRNKPESHRTFYRRDHFIQHLHHVHFANVKHPSIRLGCSARAGAPQHTESGCKELSMRWRRFGAPMRLDDPMLHCGFCGKKSKDWSVRCEHIAEHLVAGGWDRSSWWPERKENHMENLCSTQHGDYTRCRYCQKVFTNSDEMNSHTHCRVWSCRFLRTFDDVAADNVGPPLCPQFPSPKARHCHLCGAGYKSEHIEHAQQYHKYRMCNQDMYTSKEDFLQHLHTVHGASLPLLLQQNHILEQHFSRNKGASFEPVELDEMLQGCHVATPTVGFVDPFIITDSSTSSMASEETSPGTVSVAPQNWKIHDHASTSLEESYVKIRRQRSTKKPEPIPDHSGPRFFRLDPLVPYLSTKIYYLRNAKPPKIPSNGDTQLEDVSHCNIASLVMSSGLLGMAGVRMPVHMKKDISKGMVELALDD